jgi:hypothetical protein
MGRPGEMLGKACRVEPADSVLQPGEVVAVERALAADGQPHAMHRDRETLGQGAQLRERPAAIAHVVLGMDLDPGDGTGIGRGSPKCCGL